MARAHGLLLESLHFPAIYGAGAFACRLVMFYRRKLPHWHPDLTEGTFLFVTWGLAGSVPQARLSQPRTGAPRSAGRAFLILDREVDKAAFGPVSAGLAANPREWPWSSARLAGESACPTRCTT